MERREQKELSYAMYRLSIGGRPDLEMFSFCLALAPGMQAYAGHATTPTLVIGQIHEFQCTKIAVWYHQHI